MNNTRSKIIEIAKDLIHRVGLNAMSYQHISDVIGIRKASIHHHFPKKENLVDELLKDCQISYGDNYKRIVESNGSAPEKLRQLAAIFQEGLQKKELCLVGSISTNLNTLQPNSSRILEETIQNTVDIFAITFKQGIAEGSLSFSGTAEELAYAFFSFLVGVQITARVNGGVKLFQKSTEAIISGWEK